MKFAKYLILFQGLLFCSCNHYYYVANVQNIPLLKEKNDLIFSGSFGGWDESKSIEFQAAYAPSDKIGIMTNFSTVWGGDRSEKDYGKGSIFEAAAGYFSPGNFFEFEIYGGLGVSGQRHEYSIYHYDSSTGIHSSENGSSHLSFVRLFIQPSVGLSFEPLQAAISTRLCQVSYYGINYSTFNGSTIEYLSDLGDKSHYFIEPALTLRIGAKNIKAQGQISYNIYLNNSRSYFYEDAHLSGGVVITITAKKNN